MSRPPRIDTAQDIPLTIGCPQVHTESVEAALRMNRKLLLAMSVWLVIIAAGLNFYVVWSSETDVRRVIITEREVPAPDKTQEQRGNQA